MRVLFARAVAADETDDLPGPDREVDGLVGHGWDHRPW
jgi:hypothetical protein